MSLTQWIAISGLLLTAPVLVADTLSGVCTVDFAVKSTMDSFVGHVTSEAISIDPARDGALTITFGVTGMATGKTKRDEHMFHMFSATNFPMIVGTVATAELNALDPAVGKMELPIEVRMHGVTRPLVAQVPELNRTDASLVFDATFTVPLHDFGLKPPSMMKLIKVKNAVVVMAHVALARPGTEARP